MYTQVVPPSLRDVEGLKDYKIVLSGWQRFLISTHLAGRSFDWSSPSDPSIVLLIGPRSPVHPSDWFSSCFKIKNLVKLKENLAFSRE